MRLAGRVANMFAFEDDVVVVVDAGGGTVVSKSINKGSLPCLSTSRLIYNMAIISQRP